MTAIFVFIYNLCLIILYAFTMSLTLNSYLKTKNFSYLYCCGYLLFTIFDHSIIYMTEFIDSFAFFYDQVFLRSPVFKTAIFLVSDFCILSFSMKSLKMHWKPLHFTPLIILASWMMFISIIPNSALKVWFYFLPNQLFYMYLALFILWNLNRKKDLPETNQHFLLWLAKILFIASIFILLEDSYVIFNLDNYTAFNINIQNRNIFDDLFSIALCGLYIKFFLFAVPIEKTTSKLDEHQKQTEFYHYYRFTTREQEICDLLLQKKSNQAIADELYLSLGTVKTHVHNIFIKLDIKKREQIETQYQEFLTNYDELLFHN